MPVYPEASTSTAESASFAAGLLITDAWQVELRSTLFGACDVDAAYPVVQFLDGFGIPDTRNDDVPIPQDFGMVASPQFLDGRTMSIGIAVTGSTEQEVVERSADLMRAWSPIRNYQDGDVIIPLCFSLDGSTVYRVWGKPLRAEMGYGLLLRTRSAYSPFNDFAQCEFLATDPRIYSNDIHAVAVAAGVTTGGFPVAAGFPFAFPQGFGASNPSTVTANNAGNFPVYPVLTVQAVGAALINQPITITNNTTGLSLTVYAQVTGGNYLEIDINKRTILLNGDPTQTRMSTYDFKNSDWWALEPGDNVISWVVGSGSNGTLTVSHRDAWMI